MKELEFLKREFSTSLDLPMADYIKAGFPSPSQDYMDRTFDLNRDLIEHPEATFYAKVSGLSMIEAGIDEGDILVIDRALEAKNGDIVVAFIDGEFTMKYIDLSEKRQGRIWLRPANKKFPPFLITPEDEFTVWGVVSRVIKMLRR